MNQFKSIFYRILQDILQIRLALLVLLIYCLLTQLIFHTVCPWMIVTHMPCPACGLTRAGSSFLLLHFADARLWNPAIYLWIPYLLYLIVFRYVLGKHPKNALLLTAIVSIMTCALFALRIYYGSIPENIIPSKLYNFPSIW